MTRTEALKALDTALWRARAAATPTSILHIQVGHAIDALSQLKTALAQPEQEPVALKLMPREATREMLEAMDECSTEGYDERLYAGHAASVYMAAWDAQQPQPEQYITDAMKVRQAVAQALLDDVYAEELEQPEAKQSGTISITMPAPVAYLCENAVGHKYFRWKKPSSTYKPIPLYTTPPQRTWVGLDWLPKHRCGLHLSHNEHRDVYETVEEFYDVDSFISMEELAKAISEDSVWVLHWYPETPIGFHRIAASTLEAIEAKLKENT